MGAVGQLPALSHCLGSMMVACPRKIGKEGICSPQEKSRSRAYAQARYSRASLCPSGQDSARKRFGTAG